MRVDRKAASVAVLGVACLALGACATTMPAPERPGQVGQLTRAGKKVTGVMVAVHAPAADHCTYDGMESFRKREGGFHDFLFVSGAYSNPAEARIDCRTADGRSLDRTIKAPFNEDAFRLSRTAGTIGAPGALKGRGRSGCVFRRMSTPIETTTNANNVPMLTMWPRTSMGNRAAGTATAAPIPKV